MGAAFWAMTAYGPRVPYDHDSIRQWAALMMDQEMLFVVEVDGIVVGSAGGLLAALLGNVNYFHATEVWWYIRPAHRDAGVGLALLKCLEDAAREKGAVILTMIALEAVEPEKAERMYTRCGYQLTERGFSKVLQWPQPNHAGPAAA